MERGVESGGYGGGCERVEGAQGTVTVWSYLCIDIVYILYILELEQDLMLHYYDAFVSIIPPCTVVS
jgi:hypothetical protein